MKTLINFFIAVLISISSFAQIGFNYKGVIKDANGNIMANQNVKLKFTILRNSSDVYGETHTKTADANGIVIAIIGSGSEAISGNFLTINWGIGTYSLKTEIDPAPYGVYVDLGTTPFEYVPYAKHAETAANTFSGNYNDLTNQPTITPATGLESVAEYNNILKRGWRLVGANPDFYGFIGQKAVDLSYSPSNSPDNGATGESSIAMGKSTMSSGESSTAMGLGTKASGNYSTAMGSLTEAIGFSSTAMGSNTKASGQTSTAMGHDTVASGKYSTAIGDGTIASNTGVLAIGEYNIDVSNALFIVGNGFEPMRRNAMVILENGNIGIGRDTPTSLLEVAHKDGAPTFANRTNAFSIRNLGTGKSWQIYTHSTGYLELYNDGVHRGSFNPNSGVYNTVSDGRLKKDITPLDNGTLQKVLQLNPVSYLMKDQTDTNINLGLISQEVRELFPSITHYSEEQDILTLSYTELIPILIKALQEQQSIIEGQNSKIENQNKKIEAQALENTQQNANIDSLLQRMTALEVVNNQ